MRLANASIEKGEDTIRFATMQRVEYYWKRGPILEKGKTTKAWRMLILLDDEESILIL